MLENISKHIFWDTDSGSIDEEKHKNFIITRVMERGGIEDVKAVFARYDLADIRHALISARTLSDKTIAFFANRFGLDRSAFRAYRRKKEERLTWQG